MDIGLLSILRTPVVDFHRGLAFNYTEALKNAFSLHVNGAEEMKQKQRGFLLSQKRGMEDKLYIGNIHRIENHLYWNDEELADDDQIVNVVMMIGPVTRDGGACSYGTKDMRDQVLYANTIPQVVGHVFFINTPGGESSCSNDYDAIFDSCHEHDKPVVAFVDGLCASSGVRFASHADRVIVMNPRDEFGCIGSMAAFWATPDGAIDRNGSRYVEIVGDDSPEKNAWWREAAKGEYEKLKEMVNKTTQDFHQSVRENRPLVEDWMLTGETFEAQQLIPALVDEIGDFNRAIECVFALAEKKIQPARFAVADSNSDDGEEDRNEQEDMATLNEQQKAAVNISRGATMIVDDGHVKTSVQTMFGPEEQEIATPKNNPTMTEEKEKEQEAVAAEAPQTTEAPAQEESPAQEEQVNTENTDQTEDTEPSGTEENPAEEGGPVAESPAADAPGTESDDEAPAAAQTELAKVTETLHASESLVEQRDKEIAELKETLKETQKSLDEKLAEDLKVIAERDKSIAELKSSVEKQAKLIAALQAEVKELSEKPTPMVTAESGVPADNGTGEAPKAEKKLYIKSGMTYEEIRAAKKAEREASNKS